MRYLHTKDPDFFRDMDEEELLAWEDAERAAELLREDMTMERYYDNL
jgi:hypothetical protein